MPETRSIDCRSAMQQLWDYLDEELTDDHMQRIREHLAMCADCLPHAHFATRFLLAVRQTRGEVHFPEALRDRVCQALRQERPGIS